jgi:hypothetical protein
MRLELGSDFRFENADAAEALRREHIVVQGCKIVDITVSMPKRFIRHFPSFA